MSSVRRAIDLKKEAYLQEWMQLTNDPAIFRTAIGHAVTKQSSLEMINVLLNQYEALTNVTAAQKQIIRQKILMHRPTFIAENIMNSERDSALTLAVKARNIPFINFLAQWKASVVHPTAVASALRLAISKKDGPVVVSLLKISGTLDVD